MAQTPLRQQANRYNCCVLFCVPHGVRVGLGLSMGTEGWAGAGAGHGAGAGDKAGNDS